MATVYVAHDVKHDRKVAFKVLHPELAVTLGPERFQREIRTTARLHHPHILPVLDSGEAAGQLWYTMPFVEGESLRERLRRERQLPLEDALQITRQVADALGYAHSQGVVHRDIKPENILLSRGHALVADFGVARALLAAGGDQLTETGMSVGTPAYMSPEQGLADPSLDGRSDLYSLGCVLYEMLTGETPYTGPSAQAIVAKRLREPIPRVRSVRETVPVVVDQALQRVLAKAPADRFQSAEAFARALRGEGPPADKPTLSLSSYEGGAKWLKRPQVVTAIAILIAATLATVLWQRTRVQGSGPEGDTNEGPTRLAVLPFINLGDSVDDYFAEGITDEVRGKLATLSGLQVIARSSSVQYKEATKSPGQIGAELGAQYLLTGTIRWEKTPEGQRRVRVSPELIQVSTASTTWQEPFDALLTDVFQVQADVATQVAQALGLALGATEREQLAERPTQNLAAYDAYLRALDARYMDAPTAAAGFERAIALDSTFALAWAELSLTRLFYTSVGLTPHEQVERSKADAQRALALHPGLPLGHYALGGYHQRRGNYDMAVAEYAQGLTLAPNDVHLLSGLALVDLRRGRWEQALEAARRLRPLDPRSSLPPWVEATALMFLRRLPEALAVVDRAMVFDSLNPEWYRMKIESQVAQGDVAGARRALDLAIQRLGYSHAVIYFARSTFEPRLLPDSAKAFLLRLRPSAMEGDTIDWALTLALTARSLGRHRQAQAYADTARRVLELRRAAKSETDMLGGHLEVPLCLAYLISGRTRDARQACERLLARPHPDAMWRVFEVLTYARAAVELGDTDRALSVVERLAKGPGWLTPAWLRHDPTFEPLRGHPRFERVVALADSN